jgi:hypothetical protein
MAGYATHQRVTGILLAVVLMLVLTGCGTPTNEPPVIRGDVIVSPATVPVGGRATITVIATDPDGDNVVYYWEAKKGSVPAGAQGDTVVYIAPDAGGIDTVTVTVNDGQEIASRKVEIAVVIGQTPTPSPAPTDIPTLSATDTPPPTSTPSSGTIVDSVIYCTDNGSGGTEIIPIERPRTVARIRIDMKERATEHGNSLFEVEAYGPNTGGTNLLIGGRAEASSAQDGFGCEGCIAENAIDADMATRWSSDFSDPQWLEITLPELQIVNRIVLRWENAYARSYCVTVAERVTLMPTATPTLAPTPGPPLLEIFPQAEHGEAFPWAAEGGGFTYAYVESEECRHSGPYGLRLTYAMSGGGNGGGGVHWATAPSGNFDASRFSTLVFWVKGTSGGETLQIGLKDTDLREVKVESGPLVVVSASDWRSVAVPLSEFSDGGVNITSVENVNFAFHRDHGSGTICIDDIVFE